MGVKISTTLDTSGVKFSWKDKIKKITLPQELTLDLAYDIGVHIADGSMNIYHRKHKVDYYYSCSGNPETEREWYDNTLLPLKKKLFNFPDKNSLFNDKTYGIQFRSKAILEFYNKVIGLPLGKKCEIIKIPDLIYDAGLKVRLACLRGIFDADGYISFKKRHKKFHYYPYLGIGTNSESLSKQIETIFKEIHLKNSKCFVRRWDKRINKYLECYQNNVSGRKNFNKFRKIVGFRVSNDIAKIRIWEKFGYCPPNLSFVERLKILGGEIDPLEKYNGPARI
ncbi:MAG: LAGLIDADG family homing endonuclease [Candidatus Diapherotrites archaeon]